MTTWLGLEHIVPSEISQSLKKQITDDSVCRRDLKESDPWNERVESGARGWGEGTMGSN